MAAPPSSQHSAASIQLHDLSPAVWSLYTVVVVVVVVVAAACLSPFPLHCRYYALSDCSFSCEHCFFRSAPSALWAQQEQTSPLHSAPFEFESPVQPGRSRLVSEPPKPRPYSFRSSQRWRARHAHAIHHRTTTPSLRLDSIDRAQLPLQPSALKLASLPSGLL